MSNTTDNNVGSGNAQQADTPKKSLFKEFADQLISDMQQGVAPWQKPWQAGEFHAPYNPVSKTVYKGINRLMLSRKGFDDPRWMTFKQANTMDLKVRKGEKSQKIVYYQFEKDVPAVDKDGNPVLNESGVQQKERVQLDRPIVSFASVFHVSQLEGEIPPLDKSAQGFDWNPDEKAENILARSGAVIKHNQRDRAFYRRSDDTISLPPKEHFSEPAGYYATALHELGHWTGHPSRLNRDHGPFGGEAYAKEELRAEISSWMLSQDIGTAHDPSQHLSYVKSWIQALKDDPYEIVRACRDAEKIKEFVLKLELERSKEDELKQGQENFAMQGDEKTNTPERKIAQDKIFLNVPYEEKDKAKANGAKWDMTAKSWYAPPGTELSNLAPWLAHSNTRRSPAMSPEHEFAKALANAGLDLQGKLPIMDGKLHRVPLFGSVGCARDGAYKAFLDGLPAGYIQNYKDGVKLNWKASGHTLTPEQLTEIKRGAEAKQKLREAEITRQQNEKAVELKRIFDAAPRCPADHPYLIKKGILPLADIRISDKKYILVPLYNSEGELRNLQEIHPDGVKLFRAGGQKKGCFCLIDSDKKLNQGEILLAEGYATGASLNMATGKPVAVAFDAGNLTAVASKLREKFPDAAITICADNDHSKSHNVGVEKAKEAAQVVGAKVIVPVFSPGERALNLTDFNDLHQRRGLNEVMSQLSRGRKQSNPLQEGLSL